MSVRVTAAFLALLGVLCTPRDAHADSGDINVSLDGCPDLDEAALLKVLNIEIRTLAIASDFRLVIHCEGPLAIIRLESNQRVEFPVEVRVDTSSTAVTARARLIALAASELAAQAERAAERHPASEPATPKPPRAKARVRPAPERARRALRPFGDLSVRRVGSQGAWLWGAAIGAEVRAFGPLALSIDGWFERGRTAHSLASVDWSALSGSLAVVFRGGSGPVHWTAGCGLLAGRLVLSATATSPGEGRTLSGPWLGPLLELRTIAAIGRGPELFAGVDAGFVTLPMRGTVDRGPVLVKADGPWIGATIGAAYALW